MKHKKIIILSITATIAIILWTTFSLMALEITNQYTPSNITKANPLLHVDNNTMSVNTLDPRTDKITDAVIGTILSVDTPVDWTDSDGIIHGSIPVVLDISDVIRGNLTGDMLVFYVDSIKKPDGTYMLRLGEAQYEINEKVLVYLSSEPVFGDDSGKPYQIMGKYGKFRIHDNKAYSQDYPKGINLDSIKDGSFSFYEIGRPT